MPTFCISFSLYGDITHNTTHRLSCYDAIVAILENGHIRLEKHSLSFEGSFSHGNIIFRLNLSDLHESYTTILCNKDTNGLIVTRSKNETICDYCLNWGAMVGLDITQSQISAFIPAIIQTDEQGNNILLLSGTVDQNKFDLKIITGPQTKSACAIVLPTELTNCIATHQEVMPFTDGCRLGIVIAKGRNEQIEDSAIEREIEFDRIIDSMVQDGTIRVKPVSPFMAQLRTIGSTIFVKYLAIKKIIRSWWNSWKPAPQTTSNSTKQLK